MKDVRFKPIFKHVISSIISGGCLTLIGVSDLVRINGIIVVYRNTIQSGNIIKYNDELQWTNEYTCL